MLLAEPEGGEYGLRVVEDGLRNEFFLVGVASAFDELEEFAEAAEVLLGAVLEVPRALQQVDEGRRVDQALENGVDVAGVAEVLESLADGVALEPGVRQSNYLSATLFEHHFSECTF